jgi:hypothetical protein
MRAIIISLNELFLQLLCGTDRRCRAQAARRKPRTPLQYLRYWLKYWGFTPCKPCPSGMKDPRTMPTVASPTPDSCMCCWYQQFYNPTRPADPLGLCRYGMLRLVVRVFPPIKPDEINEICGPHLDLLYPPKKARGTAKSSPALGAGGVAHAEGVCA